MIKLPLHVCAVGASDDLERRRLSERQLQLAEQADSEAEPPLGGRHSGHVDGG